MTHFKIHRSFPPICWTSFSNSLPLSFPFQFRFGKHCGLWCRSYCKNRDKKGELMEHVVVDGAQVMVGDPQRLQDKITSIRLDSPSKLQVIADFDATLTKYLDRWSARAIVCSHGLLQQCNPEYDLKRQKLYEYYHPLEIDPTIPLDEKANLMEEWWEKTHALLIEGGLTYGAIKSSVANSRIAFREGVTELFELLERSNVPVLIFSAGLADIIEEVLMQKLHRSFKNVRIVSNRMVFDQNGTLVSFKGKTIHVLNKNEHAIDMAGPIYDQLGDANWLTSDVSSVKSRTNVLLLGDHIGDLGMSDGLNYNTRISVGFLNDNIQSSSDSYRDAFDVVYMNDSSMWGVVKLATQLCSTVGD
ncbi:cytosolic 5'-nucleotidase 3a [Phtheirospermum japonicum]|uniref:5'-nucleotidase n=1 Tax=Phtheirospermum japonicum TaxID=374723 RepID=A0A830CCW7_9LAMI|nr:cytosolic 5'-nucleotidase 3a [Phtheirospermum japonicum]